MRKPPANKMVGPGEVRDKAEAEPPPDPPMPPPSDHPGPAGQIGQVNAAPVLGCATGTLKMLSEQPMSDLDGEGRRLLKLEYRPGGWG